LGFLSAGFDGLSCCAIYTILIAEWL